jgi:hypothetical protein
MKVPSAGRTDAVKAWTLVAPYPRVGWFEVGRSRLKKRDSARLGARHTKFGGPKSQSSFGGWRVVSVEV